MEKGQNLPRLSYVLLVLTLTDDDDEQKERRRGCPRTTVAPDFGEEFEEDYNDEDSKEEDFEFKLVSSGGGTE